MAEYRIVAKLDPQTGPGTQKVKQDLRGVQQEAGNTRTALERAFDQAAFDRQIAALTGRLDALDKTMAGVQAQTGGLAKSNDSLAQAIDRLASSASRGAGETKKVGDSADDAAAKQARLEAALRRVLQATDQNALEQLKMNQLLADAKRLLDAGAISQEHYAQVQRMAAAAGKEQAGATAMQRMGMQQLGFQLGDVATMYSLGAKPAQIFASQIGQVTQALQMMGGEGNKFLSFLGGPWGIALSVALIALSPLVAKLFEGNDALGDAIKKKKDDARESELTRQANVRWANSLDGVIERQFKLVDALKQRWQIQQLVDGNNRQQLQQDSTRLQGDLAKARQDVANLERQLTQAKAPVVAVGRGGEAALGQQALAISRITTQLTAARGRVAEVERAIKANTEGLVISQIQAGERIGKTYVDLSARATDWSERYQGALRGILMGNERLRGQTPEISAGFEAVRAAVDKAASAGVNFSTSIGRTRELGIALKEGRISAAEYRREMVNFARGLEAAAAAATKAKQSVGDGVSTFRSARQAIGVAGRELQSAGLRVSENSQFGGTKGKHTGAGHREDRAIDVDIAGASDSFPTPPAIASKYDAMAKRYAARGYIVLWAGKRYDPSGAITPITSGDKHYGHMHIEAPQAIVGKPTQAGTEAFAQREERTEARVTERAEDFVAGVVRQAATQGVANDAKSQLDAAIANKLQEFEEKFNRAADAGEKATITKALTDADARATALRFEEAYVKPLDRLRALQGKTGIERQVLNAILDETARKGAPLTEQERQRVEQGIRGNDQLSRQAQLLEQIRGPMQAYMDLVADLNTLLARGDINQTQFNARMAELIAQAANASFSGLEGTDPATGRSYEDLGAIADENARYAEQLNNFATYRQQLLQMGIDYDALEQAARQQHADNLSKIDRARRDMQLATFQDAAGSVTSIMQSAFGEQSRIARAAFVAEKAVAIARAAIALGENVAQAAKIGFPQNIPFIAGALAQGATIMANIRSASAQFKEGGYTGDVQRNREAGVVHGQEFVVNAEATRQNRALLEAINSGRQIRQAQTGRAVQVAAAAAPAAAPMTVPAPEVALRVMNLLDPRSIVEAYLDSPEGEQKFVNLINGNADAVSRAVGQSGAV